MGGKARPGAMRPKLRLGVVATLCLQVLAEHLALIGDLGSGEEHGLSLGAPGAGEDVFLLQHGVAIHQDNSEDAKEVDISDSEQSGVSFEELQRLHEEAEHWRAEARQLARAASADQSEATRLADVAGREEEDLRSGLQGMAGLYTDIALKYRKALLPNEQAKAKEPDAALARTAARATALANASEPLAAAAGAGAGESASLLQRKSGDFDDEVELLEGKVRAARQRMHQLAIDAAQKEDLAQELREKAEEEGENVYEALHRQDAAYKAVAAKLQQLKLQKAANLLSEAKEQTEARPSSRHMEPSEVEVIKALLKKMDANMLIPDETDLEKAAEDRTDKEGSD